MTSPCTSICSGMYHKDDAPVFPALTHTATIFPHHNNIASINLEVYVIGIHAKR